MTWLNYPLRRMMVAAALLMLLVAGVSQALSVPTSNFTEVEQASTLKFLQGFAASNPALTNSWTGTDFCAWSYVSCWVGGVGLAVQGDDYASSGSTGTLTLPELADDVNGSAVKIATLSFPGFGEKLKGTLPASWGGISRLQSVGLLGNALTGTLPASWGVLPALQVVNLSNNSLTGSLPSAWGALPSLQVLNLSGNAVSGSLPDAWKSMPSLQVLHLASNALTGSLPASWGLMRSLQVVRLEGNRLCGCIPSEWVSRIQVAVVDPAVKAADCSTANACGAESPSPASSSATNTTAGAACEVEHCLECSPDNSSKCTLCAASYTPGSDPQCVPSRNAAHGPAVSGAAVWVLVFAASALAMFSTPV